MRIQRKVATINKETWLEELSLIASQRLDSVMLAETPRG
jgi:hypothetical protein